MHTLICNEQLSLIYVHCQRLTAPIIPLDAEIMLVTLNVSKRYAYC